jgi:hypothetical protein
MIGHMKPHTYLLSMALAAIALAASAQTPEGAGIVYGKDHAFAIAAPRGWVLDTASGKAQGLHAVFYQDGSNWASATTVMYTNSARKCDGQRTVEELMAYDLAQFRKHSATLEVTEPASVPTSKGTAVVRRFTGDQHGNYEAVAYIDEEQTIIMLVLSSRTKKGFDEAYPSFEELVKSYQFLTSDVRMKE